MLNFVEWDWRKMSSQEFSFPQKGGNVYGQAKEDKFIVSPSVTWSMHSLDFERSANENFPWPR